MVQQSNGSNQEDLELFRKRVTHARRLAGKQQQELAHFLGLDAHVLSRKLHGHPQVHLTRQEIKLIIKALASWDAVTTRGEVKELLATLKLKEELFSSQDWESAPLNRLEQERDAPALSEHLPPVLSSYAASQLPVFLNSYIAREALEKTVYDRLLHTDTRLLTLLGPGGIGKTRLSVQVARQIPPHIFAHGIVFLLLDAVPTASLVPDVLLQKLTSLYPSQDGDRDYLASSSTRLKHLLQQKSMLLVLDNLEHLEGVGLLISDLLKFAPEVKVLATSRRSLDVSGEYIIDVPPLETVDPVHMKDSASLAHLSAIQLFFERARAVASPFPKTDQNLVTIAQICHNLDGFPLAIELAAARSRIFSPQMLLAHLSRNDASSQPGQPGLLTFLSRKSGDVPARHHSLLQMVQWSYDLLSPSMQRLFRQLGVFADGWTFTAAQHVCERDEGSEDLLEQLEQLVNHSLVVAVAPESASGDPEQAPGETRFRFLRIIQEYAREQLYREQEWKAVQQRFLRYYQQFVEALSLEKKSTLAEEKKATQLFKQEQENIRAALTCSFAVDPLAFLFFCRVLYPFWLGCQQIGEGLRWLKQIWQWQQEMTIAQQCELLVVQGIFCLHQEEMAAGQASLEQGIELAQMHGLTRIVIWGTYTLGDTFYLQEQYEQAIALYSSVIEMSHLSDWPYYEGPATARLGAIFRQRGDLEQATQFLEKSTHLLSGDPSFEIIATGELAVLKYQQGEFQQALAYGRKTLLLSLEVGNSFNPLYAITCISCILGGLGHGEEAVILHASATFLFKQWGSSLGPIYQHMVDSVFGFLKAQGALSEERWQACEQQGYTLTYQQAIDRTFQICQQILND